MPAWQPVGWGRGNEGGIEYRVDGVGYEGEGIGGHWRIETGQSIDICLPQCRGSLFNPKLSYASNLLARG